MSVFNQKTVTNNGMNLIASGLTGGSITFKNIVLGSGIYTGNDLAAQTALVKTEHTLNITNVVRRGSLISLTATLLPNQITTDYAWSELGVIAEGDAGGEILYLYGYSTQTSIISGASLDERIIEVSVLVSSVQNVTAVIDNSLVFLTKSELDNHNTDQTAHDDIRKEIEDVNNAITDLSKFKIFTDFNQIDATFTASTPLLDIVDKMPNNSKLITNVINGNNQYPYGWGVLEITRVEYQRNEIRYTPSYTTSANDSYLCRTYDNNGVNTLSSWTKYNKVYTNLSQIGLSDNALSSTNFGANIEAILNAIPAFDTLRMYVFNSTPNLYNTLSNSLGISTDGYQLTVQKYSNTNIPNDIEVIPNRTDGANIKFISFFDNVWSGWKQLLTTGTGVAVKPNQGNTVDLNTITEPCEFYAQGCINAPSAIHGYFKHEHHINTANFAKQTYTAYNTRETWTRTKVNGTWNAWTLPNAATVQGVPVGFSYSTNSYLPAVGTGGSMEIGRILDFHLQGSTRDYDGRLYIDAQGSLLYNNAINAAYNMNIPLEINNLKSSVSRGGIKRIQRGSFTETIQNNYSRFNKTINFSAIDINKTIVILNASGGNNDASASTISLVSISNTNMVVRLGCSLGESVCSWQLIEFN